MADSEISLPYRLRYVHFDAGLQDRRWIMKLTSSRATDVPEGDNVDLESEVRVGEQLCIFSFFQQRLRELSRCPVCGTKKSYFTALAGIIFRPPRLLPTRKIIPAN